MYSSPETADAAEMPVNVEASLPAANDNSGDQGFDAMAHDVVAILLRDGLKLLAG